MKSPNWLFSDKMNFTISFLFFISMSAIAFIFDSTAGLISVILLCVYIAFVIMYIILEPKMNTNGTTGRTIASHTFDFLSKLEYPTILIDSEDKLAWYNTAYVAIYPGLNFKIGEKCKSIEAGLVSLGSFNDTDTIYLEKGGKHYKVKAYPIETAHKKFQLVIWYDSTELYEVKKRLSDSNLLVAYIVVDNISELTQGLQDQYRESGAKINRILTEWALGMNGILKEYERDKYILFFEEKYLAAQLNTKFDILDKVSEISSEESGVPLTVSIGISRIDGSFAEKEKAAKMSLQLALQRGGAQAVVKTEDDNEIFGGRTKTVQKRTKIKSRMISSSLVSEIKKSSNVLLMAHKSPDFDAVASCVGIARLSIYLGKKVNIISDFSSPSFLACRDMLQGVAEYEDIFIDSVYGQDLIVPDTLLVITDASNPVIFEAPEIYRNTLNVAIIDHHRQVTEFEKQPLIPYIEPTASSASELVSEILEYALPPMTLLKEESELMLAGILLDTQNFTRNVGIRTFSAAVYLRGEGGNPGKAQALFKYHLSEFKKLAEFERNIMIFRNIFAISQYELDNIEENRIIAARAADRMLQINGIRASFALSLVGEAIHISARSDGSVNVSLILEKLKGGGHFDSAGAKLTGVSVKQALIMLREAIVNYCEQN